MTTQETNRLFDAAVSAIHMRPPSALHVAYMRPAAEANAKNLREAGDWLDGLLGPEANYSEAMRRAQTSAELGDYPTVCYWLRIALRQTPDLSADNSRYNRLLALIAHFAARK